VPPSLAVRLALLATLVACLVALGAGATAATAASKPTRSITADDRLETTVLAELNAIRRTHGLTPLRRSKPLAAAANSHSRDMARFGFFKHESRDGSSFWHRVKRFYGSGGYGNWSVGENLLWSTTGIDARGAVKLWMKSPGHRKNILTARWREIGLSAVVVPGAPGVFDGRDVVIVTTDFGVRT